MVSKESKIFGIPSICAGIVGFLFFQFNIFITLFIGLFCMIWGIIGAVTIGTIISRQKKTKLLIEFSG